MPDQPDGPGTYTLVLPDGSKKDTSEGYTGRATALYENGDKFEGMFASGMRNGEGVYTFKNGAVFKGL